MNDTPTPLEQLARETVENIWKGYKETGKIVDDGQVAQIILSTLQKATAAANAEVARLKGKNDNLEYEVDRLRREVEEVKTERDNAVRAYRETKQTYHSVMPKAVAHDTLAACVSELERDRDRLDWLENHCFTNREGEREIHYDFRGTLRSAIDAAKDQEK